MQADLPGGVNCSKALEESIFVREVRGRKKVQQAPQLLRVVLDRSAGKQNDVGLAAALVTGRDGVERLERLERLGVLVLEPAP